MSDACVSRTILPCRSLVNTTEGRNKKTYRPDITFVTIGVMSSSWTKDQVHVFIFGYLASSLRLLLVEILYRSNEWDQCVCRSAGKNRGIGKHVCWSVTKLHRIEACNRLRDTDTTGLNDFNELAFTNEISIRRHPIRCAAQARAEIVVKISPN